MDMEYRRNYTGIDTSINANNNNSIKCICRIIKRHKAKNDLDLLYGTCVERASSIKSIFVLPCEHTLYNSNRKCVDEISVSIQIIKKQLNNINHYVRLKGKELDKEYYDLIKYTYDYIVSSLESISYVDRELLKTDKSLFELTDNLVRELAKFTVNSYEELLRGDKEQIQLSVEKFIDINNHYKLKKDALRQLNDIDSIGKELESKYTESELEKQG